MCVCVCVCVCVCLSHSVVLSLSLNSSLLLSVHTSIGCHHPLSHLFPTHNMTYTHTHTQSNSLRKKSHTFEKFVKHEVVVHALGSNLCHFWIGKLNEGIAF